MAEPEDCNVVHEQPTKGMRGAVDQVLHFWPLIAVVLVLIGTVSATLGQVYIGDIAEAKYTELKVADPVIIGIKGDITKINAALHEQVENDVEIRNQLSTIESRLDTLIRIQLERD